MNDPAPARIREPKSGPKIGAQLDLNAAPVALNQATGLPPGVQTSARFSAQTSAPSDTGTTKAVKHRKHKLKATPKRTRAPKVKKSARPPRMAGYSWRRALELAIATWIEERDR